MPMHNGSEMQFAIPEGYDPALADNACTHHNIVGRLGQLPFTATKGVRLRLGDARVVQLPNLHLHALEFRGQDPNVSYDLLIRGGEGQAAVGHVIAEDALKDVARIEVSGRPGAEREWIFDGAVLQHFRQSNLASYVLVRAITDKDRIERLLQATSPQSAQHPQFAVALLSPDSDQHGLMQLCVADRPIAGKLSPTAIPIELCAGPGRTKRQHTIIATLDALGWKGGVEIDCLYGEGLNGDLMSNRNYMHWQKMADDGNIAYAHSGVPCNQNSAAPHIAQYLASCNSTANAAHTTTIRRGLHEHGPDGDASNETTRIRSALFHRTASICNSVARNGGIVTVETPSRRSDPARPDVYDERAKGHATVFETTPYATLKAQRDLCLATTENNSWKDAEGRNKAQKSSDWLMSPELYPTLGAALNAHRDACSPTQHEKSLGGKHADGTWRTTGEGAYPDELVQTVAFHVDVWRQAMNLTGSVTADGCLLPLQQRVEATMRVRGAKKAEALTGLELLKRMHLATGHFGLAQILKILKYMGWSKRIAADDVRAYGKWRCVICALCLAKRRAFHSVPVDATKPHPGKVWQMDQLEFRVGPPYYVNLFACVSCRVTVSLPHNTMTTDAIILTVGKLRALVRPYHGEIHIIKADSVSAVKARAFDDYAASETVDAGGASFNVQIAAGGIHEGVAMPEAAFGKYVPETLACLKHSGRAAKWAVKAFFDVENKHNSYVIHAGETKPPLQIFFEACDPPRSAPYCPLCIWGAPAAYTVDPLALTSKWEDRSKAGWYAGASRKACGPFGYSIADIITVHGASRCTEPNGPGNV